MDNQATKKTAISVYLFVLVAVPAVLFLRFYRNLPREPLSIGAKAPRFKVEPVKGANGVEGKGRKVVLYFFSPTCQHCERTLTQFERLRETHPEWFFGRNPFRWMFISIADKSSTTQFAENVSWPIYCDSKHEAMKSLRGISVPYLVLIDEDGCVQYRHHGERSLAQHEAILNSFYKEGVIPKLFE